MAPRKKKSRKKVSVSNAAKPLEAVLQPSSPPASQPSHWGKILVTVLLVVVLYEILNTLHQNLHLKPSSKDFKVQSVVRIDPKNDVFGQFGAYGMAPIGKDNLIIADTLNNRLLMFNRHGAFLRAVAKDNRGLETFKDPWGMTCDDKGNAYVIEAGSGIISGFNGNGKRFLNLPLGPLGGFSGPRGVGWDGKNFIVADTGTSRIVLLSPTEGVKAVWGKRGKDPGEFMDPVNVASDGKGNYFVADYNNLRLQWLNQAGQVVKAIPYDLKVSAVAVDKEGRFYAALEGREGGVKAYSPKGDYLGDLVDQDGFRDLFTDVRGMCVSTDDLLTVMTGTEAAAFQLPPTP